MSQDRDYLQSGFDLLEGTTFAPERVDASMKEEAKDDKLTAGQDDAGTDSDGEGTLENNQRRVQKRHNADPQVTGCTPLTQIGATGAIREVGRAASLNATALSVEDVLADEELLLAQASIEQAQNESSWRLVVYGFPNTAVSDAFHASQAGLRLMSCPVISLMYIVQVVMWVRSLKDGTAGISFGHWWFQPACAVSVYCCGIVSGGFLMYRSQPMKNRRSIQILTFVAVLLISIGDLLRARI